MCVKSKLLRAYFAVLMGFMVWVGLFRLYPGALALSVNNNWVQVVCTQEQISKIRTIVKNGLEKKELLENISIKLYDALDHRFFLQLIISSDVEGYRNGSIVTFKGMVPNNVVNGYNTIIEDPQFMVELYPVLQHFFAVYEGLCLVIALGTSAFVYWFMKRISLKRIHSIAAFSWIRTMTDQLLCVFVISIVSFCLIFGFLYTQRYTLVEGLLSVMNWHDQLELSFTQIEESISSLHEQKAIEKKIRELMPSSSQVFLYGSDGMFLEALNSTDPDMLDYTKALGPLYYSRYMSIDSGKDEILLVVTDYPFLKEVRVYTLMAFIYSALIVFFWLKWYMNEQIERIQALERHVEAFSLGDWQYPINAKEGDELEHLGKELENLRISYIEKTRQEQEAQMRNQALITDLSHDLRTPLTILKGYLEIIECQDQALDEKTKRYIVLANQKADHIKELSDRMFETALIQQETISLHPKPIESNRIVQAIKEYCQTLEQKGFAVKKDIKAETKILMMDMSAFQRIIDNVFSNLEKYADPEFDIEINIILNDHLDLRIVNRKNKIRDQKSSHVGLQSVRKLINGQQGILKIEETDTMFMQTILIPGPYAS